MASRVTRASLKRRTETSPSTWSSNQDGKHPKLIQIQADNVRGHRNASQVEQNRKGGTKTGDKLQPEASVDILQANYIQREDDASEATHEETGCDHSAPVMKWSLNIKHVVRGSCYDSKRQVFWLRTDCTCPSKGPVLRVNPFVVKELGSTCIHTITTEAAKQVTCPQITELGAEIVDKGAYNSGIDLDTKNDLLLFSKINKLQFIIPDTFTEAGTMSIPGCMGILFTAYSAAQHRYIVCDGEYIVYLIDATAQTVLQTVSTPGGCSRSLWPDAIRCYRDNQMVIVDSLQESIRLFQLPTEPLKGKSFRHIKIESAKSATCCSMPCYGSSFDTEGRVYSCMSSVNSQIMRYNLNCPRQNLETGSLAEDEVPLSHDQWEGVIPTHMILGPRPSIVSVTDNMCMLLFGQPYLQFFAIPK